MIDNNNDGIDDRLQGAPPATNPAMAQAQPGMVMAQVSLKDSQSSPLT
jgi:hypothetical protein